MSRIAMLTSFILLTGLSTACSSVDNGQYALLDSATMVAPAAADRVTMLPDVDAAELAEAIKRGAELLVGMEEGEANGKGEWPYEGVYRVGGRIPIGYRVGGTGISCLAMALADGYGNDTPRQEAVARGVAFVSRSIEHKQMSETEYSGGYDVRCWGYIYGAHFLLELEKRELLPAAHADEAKKAARWYVDATQKLEIPGSGGWNYARRGSRDAPSAPSSFMTSSALQMLFLAKDMGLQVSDDVLSRSVKFLKNARNDAGEFVYSGEATRRSRGGVPGAIGRMVASESTLFLAGEATATEVRGSIDAFIVHWEWLEKRRRQTGTHVAPYGVAPYYFFFAHRYAALAVECLPAHERGEYHRRINQLLFSIREDNGAWNDRVFPRSANYGTAMAMLGIMSPKYGLPPRWENPGKSD